MLTSVPVFLTRCVPDTYYFYCTVPCKLGKEPLSTRGTSASTSEHLVSQILERIGVRRFVKKRNPCFFEVLCGHLHSTLNILYQLYSTTPDRYLARVASRPVGSDDQSQVPLLLPYSADEKFQVFPSATSCRLFVILSACHPFQCSQLLLTKAFFMTSTNAA